MKNEEIIRKSLVKSVKNGFDWTDSKTSVDYVEVCVGGAWFYEKDGTGAYYPISQIIFSHDFAKALWGDEFDYDNSEDSSDVLSGYIGGYEWEFYGKRWEAHLMMMVLSEDPIKYLEKFLDK